MQDLQTKKETKTTNYAPIMVCLQNYTPELFWVILCVFVGILCRFRFCSCFAPLSIIHTSFFSHLQNSGSRGERRLTPWTGRQFIIYFLLLSYYFALLCCLCFLQFLLLLLVLLQLISLPLCVFAIILLSFFISFWLISVSCCFVI